MGRLDYSDGKNVWYYGYTGTRYTAQLTDKEGALAVSYSYDAFGNTVVRDYIGNITGNRNITENYTLNPCTYNAEYTDASTGIQAGILSGILNGHAWFLSRKMDMPVPFYVTAK